MPQQLRIGSRPSRLALAQAAIVRDSIARNAPGADCEIVPIKTTGDKLTTASLANVGGKGLFVRELEQALAAGRIDLAVHSVKDMPARLPLGFRLIAVPAREDTADILLTNGPDLAGLPQGARLGTSSLRRRFEMARVRPDFEIQPLRGNVDTRLARLRAGEFDAIILAAAGLKRLGASDLPPMYRLSENDFVPAGGQGALAIEGKADRLTGGSAEIEAALAAIDHLRTRLEITAERAFLAEVGASCASPVGVRATASQGQLGIRVLLFSLDGSKSMSDSHSVPTTGQAGDAERAGADLARRMLERGAAELIDDGG